MDYAFAAFLLNIIYFVLAVGVGWAVLRGLDKLNGLEFTNTYAEMKNGNMALALYYGLRFLGVCIIASAFLS